MSTTTTNPLLLLADRLSPQVGEYESIPVQWIREKTHNHLTRKQQDIANSVVEHRYTAAKSAHDLGKSFDAACIVCWWIDAHPPGEAFVVTTAPTTAQVGAILWREIGRIHRKAGLSGYITGENEWKLNWAAGPAELVAFGRKPADYDPAAFSGIHARFVLVVIDEAGGVPKTIFDAVDTLVTNEAARVLAIGNPDDPASHFATVCKPDSGWNVIRMDGLESPNFTAEAVARFPKLKQYMIEQGITPSTEHIPDEVRPLLLSPMWVDERIQRWGVSSPMFISKVRGDFPKVSQNSLIEPHWIALAQAREVEVTNTAAGRLGVDVARYGTDHTIIVRQQLGRCRVVADIPRGPTTGVVDEVLKIAAELVPAPPLAANVDDTGIGGGVTDELVQRHGYPTLPIVSSGRQVSERPEDFLPNGTPRFFNRRSEIWWRAREMFMGRSGTGEDAFIDLDPEDLDLAAQLMNVRYKINSRGQIQVESKDEMKARGLESPDRADALVMSLQLDPIISRQVMRELMLTSDVLRREW